MRRDDLILPTAEQHERWMVTDRRRRAWIASELAALASQLPADQRDRLVALAFDMAVGDASVIDAVQEWSGLNWYQAPDPSWRADP